MASAHTTAERRALEEALRHGREEMRGGEARAALEHYDAAFRLLPTAGTAAEASDLLRWTGHIHRVQGDYEVAGELYEAALAVAEASGLGAQSASATNDLGHIAHLEGDLDRAERLYARALEGATACGDRRLVAMAEQNLGVVANIRGDVKGAMERYALSLREYQELGDDLAAAWALNNIGMAQVDLELFSAAADSFDRAMGFAERAADVGTQATVQLNRAELHLKAGDATRARGACDRAFDLFGRLESHTGLAETYKLYAALYREQGKPALAEAHLAVLAGVARSCQDVLLEAEVESDRALLHQSEGRNRDALIALNRAHALFSSLRARREVADLEQRLDQLEKNYLLVVQAWGESIESKDEYTAGHCSRVADLTCALAAASGFDGRDLRWVRMGAFLHDVGKTAVPVELLNKDGALTPEEWEVIKRHPATGDALVAEIGFPWDIRPMVRGHHERWDGQGYPDGLAGEEIPLLARILCVADVFDALTTARSYRPALDRDDALALMRQESGRKLDPGLFERFEAMVASGELDGVVPASGRG